MNALIAGFLALGLCFAQAGEEPLPPLTAPANVEAIDTPDDAGKSITLMWDKVSYGKRDVRYVVMASFESGGPEVKGGEIPAMAPGAESIPKPWWAWKKDPTRHVFQVNTEALAGEFLLLHSGPDILRAWKTKEELQQEQKGLLARLGVVNTEYCVARDAGKEDAEKKALVERLELKERIEGIERGVASLDRAIQEELDRYAFAALTFRVGTVFESNPPVFASPVRVAPVGNWFNFGKINSLMVSVLLCACVLVFIQAGKSRKLFLRKISGLEAVDEAVGRATEMGKPVLFLTGLWDIDQVNTIAAVTILGEVARKCARLGARLIVPHTRAITYMVSQEVVKQAYIEAGRPDAYRDDINFFVTESQFAFAAAVDGIMVRERPAAVIYMGAFFAESLILAETGCSIKAIQVAGTDQEHQLPFFVTACDYTLLGEELYAASAYLSRRPDQVGTLRGQDVGKGFVILGIALGTLAAVFFALTGRMEWMPYLLDFLRPW